MVHCKSLLVRALQVFSNVCSFYADCPLTAYYNFLEIPFYLLISITKQEGQDQENGHVAVIRWRNQLCALPGISKILTNLNIYMYSCTAWFGRLVDNLDRKWTWILDFYFQSYSGVPFLLKCNYNVALCYREFLQYFQDSTSNGQFFVLNNKSITVQETPLYSGDPGFKEEFFLSFSAVPSHMTDPTHSNIKSSMHSPSEVENAHDKCMG